MALLYANENFPLPVVEKLRRFGHEVLTTHEASEAGKSVPDEQVLACFSIISIRFSCICDLRHDGALRKALEGGK